MNVTTDELIFDDKERGPDQDLALQFEAVKNFTDEEKQATKLLLESLILKHDSQRFRQQSQGH